MPEEYLNVYGRLSRKDEAECEEDSLFSEYMNTGALTHVELPNQHLGESQSLFYLEED